VIVELVRNRVLMGTVALLLWGGSVAAQDSKPAKPGNPDKTAAAAADQQEEKAQPAADPLKRPLTDKQRKKQEEAFKREVGKTYKKWLDEEVRWIISDEERSAFKQLSNDEERDQFIEQFWLRRDPTPDTVENEFKEEHYRRVAYANERFAAGIPGWRTDRGRIYIMYGAADQIEAHPSGGAYQRPAEEGGGTTSTYPFETWRYRYLEGVGQEIIIEFVDTCMCGEYHITIDRSEKDALLNVPGAGLTDYESMGLASKTDRFTGGGMERLGTGAFNQGNQSKQFDRLEQFAKLMRPPAVKFKDLEEVVSHKISVNLMPFDIRTDFVRVTSESVLVPVTIQIKNRDISFVNKEGIQRGVVNIFGRVTTMTGRIAQTFEDTVQVDVPEELLPRTLENASVYWKALPLRAGRYRMDVVLKDVNGDRVGTYSRALTVPEFTDDRLAGSSLILADKMEKVPGKSVGTGNFVIGSTYVRPRVAPASGSPASFKRGQRMNFWMQVYNLAVNDQTKKPDAVIEYDVVNTANNKNVIHAVESTDKMGNIGDQLTLEKNIPLSGLEPGIYSITIKVKDNISQQTISPMAKFAVEADPTPVQRAAAPGK
jgi:GWxTD domain-containing protein